MPRLSELIRQPSITLELSQPSIEIPYFFESDQRVAIPRLENHQGEVVPLQIAETEDAWRLRKQVDKEFVSLSRSIAREEPLTLDRMRALAVCLVQALHRSDQLVAQVFTARPLSSRLVANALNVAVLATKLGMGLQYASEDLLDVAMAALLHDLEQLMAPEFPMRRASHGGVGNEIPQPLLPTCHGPLLKHLPEYAWLGAVAGQVQERWNGQGRPQGLKGAAIHEYAQVIGLADRFETLVNVEGLTAHEAMRRLLTTEKAAFRGQLLKTLVQQISLFPVGTVVRLNTGEVGTVEQTNPAHPLRPVLRMASGPPRAAHEGRPLKDLSQDLLVHVTETLNP